MPSDSPTDRRDVCARPPLLFLAAVLSLPVWCAAEVSWYASTKIDPPRFDDSKFMGTVLAVSDGTLLAGQPNAIGAGGATVYELDEGTGEWVRMQKLEPADPAFSFSFGSATAIWGDTLVIGASQYNYDDGRVHVYDRDPVTRFWTKTTVLEATDPEPPRYFGTSVAIHEDTIAVGAPHTTNSSEETGAVYLFKRDPETGTWDRDTRLVSNGGINDEFGISVALEKDRLVVGAEEDEEVDRYNGAVYVFDRDVQTATWDLTEKLVASDASFGSFLGHSVAIDGSTLVSGAYAADWPEFNAGAVYVFEYDDSIETWSETAKFERAEGAEWDLFGISVAVSGDTIVAGADGVESFGITAGAAFVFERDSETGVWNPTGNLVAPNRKDSDAFGSSVATENGIVFVGAPGDDEPIFSSGTVHLFEPITIDPVLSFSGNCPGEVTLTATGMTPLGYAQLYRATSGGASNPEASCLEATLDLADPLLVAAIQLDEIGESSQSAKLPDSACGQIVQMIDLASCATTEPVFVP